MADSQIDSSVMLKTNSKILVTVEEALQDILVVSYAVESKLFQGVLLDSTKKYLPCRIAESAVPQRGSPKAELTEEDKLLFSIRQRFTYFQEKPVHVNFHLQKKLAKTKTQKMTVRLRPRQVLCSKCKSICNENSENVNASQPVKQGKKPEPPDSSPRPLFSENRRDNQLANSSPPTKLCPTFVQRIPRLQSTEMSPVNGHPPLIARTDDYWLRPEDEENIDQCDPLRESQEETDRQMVLRKKRSVGSMEDLWDETVFEEGSKKAKTTPVIKISFGTQGEGTVLKIPSKVSMCSESESEEVKEELPSVSKAAKKAMKKAKKEAKRKVLSEGPIKEKSPSPLEEQYRKHRHKMKRKKKHKTEKIEDRQRLSINLKRVTRTRYERAEASSDSSSVSSEDSPELAVSSPPEVSSEQAPLAVSGPPDVASCQTLRGSSLTVGDIVWGKVHGFPWWPAKVLNIFLRQGSDEWDANVTWYGSSTSSLLPCDQLSPFLPSFKVRYNSKRKTAGYKEAIRLARSEASTKEAPFLPESFDKNEPKS